MIKLTKPKLFNFIVYFYFGCFLVILFSSFSSIIKILSGNLVELRSALYSGESITDISIGGAFKPVFIVANVFGGFSMIMILFYYYSITYLKKSKLFNIIILLSSLSVIINGIIGVDRSQVMYWMISYGFVLILFWRNLSKKQIKNLIPISIVILSSIVTYFLMVTFSRFDTRDAGSGGSLISYTGQSFVNFCYFFDKVEYREFSLQRIFPLFYKLFVNNNIENSGQLNDVIQLATGKSLGVFSTFIGAIMVSSGKVAAIIYCLFFFIFASLLTNFKRRKINYFYQIVLLFCLISIPMFGVFTHFYDSFPRIITLYVFLIYCLNLRVHVLKTSRKAKSYTLIKRYTL